MYNVLVLGFMSKKCFDTLYEPLYTIKKEINRNAEVKSYLRLSFPILKKNKNKYFSLVNVFVPFTK